MTTRQLRPGSICRLALSIGGALVLAGCGASPEPQKATEQANVAPAVTPRTSINALMVTMIDNAGHVLWDVEKEGFAPKNDADWIEVEDHATQLAAAGTLIQLGGTGPADMGWIRQVGWKTNADAMSDAALTALSAVKSRNMEALVKANGDLVASCENCHKAFKPELPTEGSPTSAHTPSRAPAVPALIDGPSALHAEAGRIRSLIRAIIRPSSTKKRRVCLSFFRPRGGQR